jgi:hypothetical protein
MVVREANCILEGVTSDAAIFSGVRAVETGAVESRGILW